MVNIYHGPVVIISNRDNIVINQGFLTETLMMEYAEACFKRIIRYWKIGSEKSYVKFDDIYEEIIDILLNLTNSKIPIWNQNREIDGLIQDDAIKAMLKILYGIEDYIRYEWFVEEASLESIDIKILDIKLGMVQIIPTFKSNYE